LLPSFILKSPSTNYGRTIFSSTFCTAASNATGTGRVPQEGVLSPTLFKIFMKDLVFGLPKGTPTKLWISMQTMKVIEWKNKWCVTINKNKSYTTLSPLPPRNKLDNTP
jgi:hypothetical protein